MRITSKRFFYYGKWVVGGGLALALALGTGWFVAADQAIQPPAQPERYQVVLEPLNGSAVRGTAAITLGSDVAQPTMQVSAQSTGLKPGALQGAAIFGRPTAASICPTMANDTNHTGYVNLGEAIAATGPMKYGLTVNPVNVAYQRDATAKAWGQKLYAPVAGVPTKGDWPKADAAGHATLNTTYKFGQTASLAPPLYQSLRPLDQQTMMFFVNHSTDIAAPVQNAGEKSDHSIPVACGRIVRQVSATTTAPTVAQPTAAPGTTNAAPSPGATPAIQNASLAGVDAFASSYQAAQAAFDQGISRSLTDGYTKNEAASSRAMHDFAYKLNQAETRYQTDLSQALARYRSAVATNGANSAAAGRTLMEATSAARQAYLNTVDQAALGMNGHPVSQTAYGQYNALRSDYLAKTDQAMRMTL